MTRSRWMAVGAAAVLMVVAVVAGPISLQIARIEGLAMAPTLGNQDRVLVNRWAYVLTSPQRGDLVMFRYPPDPRRSFIKRVIAVGGDTVRVEDGRVYVNGQRLDDAYVAPEGRSHDTRGSHVVPSGSYFVLGDRRNNSSDSRHWGDVPEHLVLGRVALRIYPSVNRLQ